MESNHLHDALQASASSISQRHVKLERPVGIEPTASAWTAEVLPLYDGRVWSGISVTIRYLNLGKVLCFHYTNAAFSCGAGSE